MAGKPKRVDRICEYCDSPFSPELRHVLKGNGKFCTRGCKNRGMYHRPVDKRGENNPNWKGGKASEPYYSYTKEYKQNNSEKISAQKRVLRAKRSGKLEKHPCEICGDENSEAHHDDYSQPLEVRWFCRKHHNELHRKVKEEVAA